LRDIQFCDLHCDTAMLLLNGQSLNSQSTQVNIPFLKEANVALQLFACYLPPSIPHKKRSAVILKMLDNLKQELQINSDTISPCLDFSSVKNVLNNKQIGAVLTIENGMALENDLRNLELYYDEGIRLLTIVHAESHEWAISSNDKNPQFNGLNAFGEKVIAAMNEMGMIIDLSHAHDGTVAKVLKLTKKPVIATHSGVYSLCSVQRNLKENHIKGIADSGGMIGINFFPGFLDDNYMKTLNADAGNLFDQLSKSERRAGDDIVKIAGMYDDFRREFQQNISRIDVPVDRIIDHVDYVINLVGDDFVGFGSDFDGVPDLPQGIEDCRGFTLIRDKLIERGYSRETLEKICYKNFLRVFESQES